MNGFAILCLALLVDALLGEPRWLWSRLPHPAVIMGRAIAWGDAKLNRGAARRLKGTALMLGLVMLAGLVGAGLAQKGWGVEVIILAILLAHRSLIDHVRAVARDLRLSTGDGRRAVAMIVGRDTTFMNDTDIARAAIESGAENFSDGVLAPAFWYLIGGLPGLLIYKITNTADSMIGYRTAKYEEFGWAAARLDDLLNLIPARLTALVIALTEGLNAKWREISTDARLHRSPNAGWPEAALSRAIDVALSGPRTYNGDLRTFPFVHSEGRVDIGAKDIDDACAALWRVWRVSFVICATLAILT